MIKLILTGLLFLCFSIAVSSQKLWTEADRKYLLDNLSRTRDSLTKETQNLSDAQWNFKESPDRWSIKEVVEHIDIWELLLQYEVSKAIMAGPKPEMNAKARPDSTYLNFILEQKPHISVEYTKPFTFTLPMGLDDGKNNVAWFLKMRNESIEYLKKAEEDLRNYFQPNGKNVHQVYISIFGHCERHLRQIRKIKANPDYPKQ